MMSRTHPQEDAEDLLILENEDGWAMVGHEIEKVRVEVHTTGPKGPKEKRCNTSLRPMRRSHSQSSQWSQFMPSDVCEVCDSEQLLKTLPHLKRPD